MENKLKRILLFTLLCIPIRILLTYMAMTCDKKTLNLMGVLALIVSFGFMYIYVTGGRLTGSETMGDPIWWNFLRPVHALLYCIFAIMAINSKKNAHVPLAIDTTIGFLAFMHYHFVP